MALALKRSRSTSHRVRVHSAVSKKHLDSHWTRRRKLEAVLLLFPRRLSFVLKRETRRSFLPLAQGSIQIDELQALIMLRSFLHNQGMPPMSDTASLSNMAAELVDFLRTFSHFRVLIPLFRAKENSEDLLFPVALALKEQLEVLEVLFWTVWEYVSCSGPLLESLFSAAYSTTLGSSQTNNTLLLDEESVQLAQDCTAIWILITVEVLELENT
jgi:nuclear pore complex protein Nup188